MFNAREKLRKRTRNLRKTKENIIINTSLRLKACENRTRNWVIFEERRDLKYFLSFSVRD